MKTIVLYSNFNSFTGYGIKLNELVRGLKSRGYTVKCRAKFQTEQFGSVVPEDIQDCYVDGIQSEKFEVVMYPPRFVQEFGRTPGKKQVLFTMWEPDRLPSHFVEDLNSIHGLIVPTEWNRDVFSKSGVNVQMEVAPLGIDYGKYYPDLAVYDTDCVFGAAGRVNHGYSRKGVQWAIDIFKKAFPTEADVKLKIKCFPDCKLNNNFDSRVEITRAFLSDTSMREWYQGLTCYLDTTLSEGFGLHQLEANACGKVVLGANNSGKVFYKFPENLKAQFKKVRVNNDEIYEGIGSWAKLDEANYIKRMREVYAFREQIWINGQNLGQRLKREQPYSTEKMIDGFIEALKSLGVV